MPSLAHVPKIKPKDYYFSYVLPHVTYFEAGGDNMTLGKYSRVLTLGLASFTVSFPHIASACPTYDFLTRKDFAAANVVFEGTVTAIHPTIKEFTVGDETNERVIALDITFDIEKVVRGSPDQRFIRVSWIHGTFGYPRSIEELRETYGEKLRVGLITPEAMTDDCSRQINTKKTAAGYKSELIKINCKMGYRAENSSDPRSGYPTPKPFIMNGPCTGPYMFETTSRRDDPSRDLSKNVVGKEVFQLENRKEITEFTRAYIERHPDKAQKYSGDAGVQQSFMEDLSTFSNFDVSRLEPLKKLTYKDFDDMSLEQVEAFFFMKLARRVFENEYEYYQRRNAVSE